MTYAFPQIISTPKRKILARRAKTYFSRHEDREDFIQTAIAIAIERWQQKGFPLFDGKPDIDRAELLAAIARRKHLKEQRNYTESRGGEFTLSQRLIESDFFNGFSSRPFGQFLDQCCPMNPKDKASSASIVLVGPNNQRVRMTYDELAEFTGFTRDSISRIVRCRSLRAFLFDDKLYPRLIDIQNKYGLSEAAARWRSKSIKFYIERDTDGRQGPGDSIHQRVDG